MDSPKGKTHSNSTALLELWEDFLAVERPWRIAVGMMYGGPWLIGAGFVAFAFDICAWLLVTGGTASATGIWKVLLFATFGCILLGIAVSLLGAAIRPIAALPVRKFCRGHGVLDLPPGPPPQVTERFGHHRVFASSESELLLGQQRAAALRESVRALAAGAFLALVILIQIALSSWLWRIVAIGSGLAAVAAWIRSLATPVAVQWLATGEGGNRRLTVEYARLIFQRFVRDLAANEIVRLRVTEGKLYLGLRNGEEVLLATVGFGSAGRWRTRRIGAAIQRIVGGPNRVRYENDQVVERLEN